MSDLKATFHIEMTPSDGLLDGTARFDFTKTWEGDLAGRSVGVMLSAGDPGSGDAGYVALERFEGTAAGGEGAVVLQQYGRMSGGTSELTYTVVPGSGTGALAGLDGTVELEIVDGLHHVTLHRP